MVLCAGSCRLAPSTYTPDPLQVEKNLRVYFPDPLSAVSPSTHSFLLKVARGILFSTIHNPD